MNVAILLDNNVSKVQTTIFENALKSNTYNKLINFTVFVGEKNKSDVSNISLNKRFLTHKKEFLNALQNPRIGINRLIKNKFSRLDFYYFSLKKELNSYDVVYTQDISRSLYTISELKKFFNYKIVVRWWETIPYKWLFNEKDTYIAQNSLDKIDIFIPATEKAKNSLILNGIPEDKIVHIYPTIDTEKFIPSTDSSKIIFYKNKFSIPDDKLVILFVGRLVTHKGIYSLLWASKILEKMSILRKLIFVIVGDGGQKELFKKMIRDMNLTNNFVFTGKIPYNEMPFIYNISDIFILPSTMKVNIQEQIPYAIIEALACGKPVIGSYVVGIPEAIGDAGIIVPPGDYCQLAEAIKYLLDNEKLRIELSIKARERAEKIFSCKINTPKMISLLLNLNKK